MSFRGASPEIPRYPESDSLANLADSSAKRNRNKHELPPLPSSEPQPQPSPLDLSLSRGSFYALFQTRNSMRAKSDLGQKGRCAPQTNQSWPTQEKRKRSPQRVTRERSTPAPPEAEAPSGRHLKSNTTNNVIAPGSEVNMSRLRIRPNP